MTFFEQITKDVRQAPGWVPLLAVCYFATPTVADWIPRCAGFLTKDQEAVAAMAAAVLYVVGDALDKVVFPRKKEGILRGWRWLAPVKLSGKQETARASLLVDDGIYDISKDLVEAAKKYSGSAIQFKNEFAKFLRSLVLPAVVLALVLPWKAEFQWPVGLIAFVPLLAAFALLFCYGRLKSDHMCDLYSEAVKLVGDTRLPYKPIDLKKEGIRLFFWDGKLASSGILAADAKA